MTEDDYCFWGLTIDNRMRCIFHIPAHDRPMTLAEQEEERMKNVARTGNATMEEFVK